MSHAASMPLPSSWKADIPFPCCFHLSICFVSDVFLLMCRITFGVDVIRWRFSPTIGNDPRADQLVNQALISSGDREQAALAFLSIRDEKTREKEGDRDGVTAQD